MRTPLLLLVVGTLCWLVAGPVAAHAQNPPSGPSSPNNAGQSVVVQGCIDGNRFRPDRLIPTTEMIFAALHVDELRLQGPKGVMNGVKQHDGHQDEITGVVIVPENVNARVQTRQVGSRTRITGATSAPGPDPRAAPVGTRHPSSIDTSSPDSLDEIEATLWLRMTVTSIRHLSNGCLLKD